MEIYRLQPHDPASHRYWPQFEQRVRRFLDKFETELSEDQRKRFFTEMLVRWSQYPQVCGYWLILAGEGLEQRDVGHLYAYVQDHYGKPYILLRQTECEEAWESREMFRQAIEETSAWVADLNRVQRENKAPLIELVQHWTVRSPEAWKRFMPELKQEKLFSVMVWRV